MTEHHTSHMHKPLSLAFLTALMSMTAMAQDIPDRGTTDPHAQAEGTWIGITGEVESTSSEGFVLDYGPGTIKVQLEANSDKQRKFLKDEQVRVYGVMEDGFFSGKTIRAHAVYVESLKQYVCTTEGAETKCASFAPAIFSGVVVHGRVTKADADKIEIESGDESLAVDLSALKGEGTASATRPAPQVGDVVTVLGHMDEGIFTRKLMASSLEIE